MAAIEAERDATNVDDTRRTPGPILGLEGLLHSPSGNVRISALNRAPFFSRRGKLLRRCIFRLDVAMVTVVAVRSTTYLLSEAQSLHGRNMNFAMGVGPISATVDLTGKVPLEGTHHIAAWIFPPRGTTSDSVPLLWCLPGGSYSKAYWHFQVPGHHDYSFAEYCSARGMLTIAVDHIGTGDSSRHSRASELLPQVVAGANELAYAELTARATAGELVPGLGASAIGPRVGVGHSMGAMLAVIQQSRYDSFDAVASLGFGNVGPNVSFTGVTGESWATEDEVMEIAYSGALDEPVIVPRSVLAQSIPLMREHIYGDLPDEIINADEQTNTPLPGVTGMLSTVPFIIADHAARIRCPVFIGLGERDSTSSHYDEMKAFRSSRDISLYILDGSAHCHNYANTRHLLWDRLARWISALPSRK
jgi:pimeloyl-ACP methyl ester carboxylesterase